LEVAMPSQLQPTEALNQRPSAKPVVIVLLLLLVAVTGAIVTTQAAPVQARPTRPAPQLVSHVDRADQLAHRARMVRVEEF
jgi:hypothetical protein